MRYCIRRRLQIEQQGASALFQVSGPSSRRELLAVLEDHFIAAIRGINDLSPFDYAIHHLRLSRNKLAESTMSQIVGPW
jgi:hypothetical protein